MVVLQPPSPTGKLKNIMEEKVKVVKELALILEDKVKNHKPEGTNFVFDELLKKIAEL